MNKGLAKGLAVGFAAGAMVFSVIAVQAAPQENRPFEAILEGGTQVVGFSGGAVSTQSAGNIRGTHIGNGTYTITADQDYLRHQEDSTQHLVGNCAFVEDDESGLVITAANGDQIFGDIDDDRSVVCAPQTQTAPPQPGDVYYSTIFTNVTGGSGRFADASGWLFSEGTSVLGASLATTEDEAQVYGDIDY
jgi:hypothetical protein